MSPEETNEWQQFQDDERARRLTDWEQWCALSTQEQDQIIREKLAANEQLRNEILAGLWRTGDGE